MKGKRTGADYYACKPDRHMNDVEWMRGWQRRASSGWLPIKEPKTYKPHNADNLMQLAVGRAGIRLQHGTNVLPGMAVWLVRKGFGLPDDVTVIAEGSLKDLWGLFLQHGRMVLTE